MTGRRRTYSCERAGQRRRFFFKIDVKRLLLVRFWLILATCGGANCSLLARRSLVGFPGVTAKKGSGIDVQTSFSLKGESFVERVESK
jgi:hypothetical protein